MARYAEAQQKMADYDRMEAENNRANQVLNELHAEGLIDVGDDGKISPSKKKLPL